MGSDRLLCEGLEGGEVVPFERILPSGDTRPIVSQFGERYKVVQASLRTVVDIAQLCGGRRNMHVSAVVGKATVLTKFSSVEFYAPERLYVRLTALHTVTKRGGATNGFPVTIPNWFRRATMIRFHPRLFPIRTPQNAPHSIVESIRDEMSCIWW